LSVAEQPQAMRALLSQQYGPQTNAQTNPDILARESVPKPYA